MSKRNDAVYIISVAAELAGVHPQTLRIYERKGLIEPVFGIMKDQMAVPHAGWHQALLG